MDKQRLLSLLEELHAELAEAVELDAETRTALAGLAGDAQRVLESPAEQETTPSGDDAPVSGLLRERLLEFGSEHPQLAKALNQVADGLANLGI
ncbi:MAG: DUF4404 family protein [Pirellulales bacterium]|nr:DUF4404 family protein [Pirellulales bacterium]